MRCVEEPVTSVGIDVLKEIITPRVIDTFRALAHCTCHPELHDVDDQIQKLQDLLEMISFGPKALLPDFSSKENKKREGRPEIVMKVDLKDIVDEVCLE